MRFRNLYPFWIVFSIETVFILYLILGHRGVVGHDAFMYFDLQYYFLSNATTSGETAQWLPLITHGTVANWWYGIQAGILQCAMLTFGRLNSVLLGLNFLPIYYLGLLFDLSVFLLGILLLGRRYFTSNLKLPESGRSASLWLVLPFYLLLVDIKLHRKPAYENKRVRSTFSLQLMSFKPAKP